MLELSDVTGQNHELSRHPWRWYREGSEKQRGLLSYDPARLQVAHDALLAVFDEALLTRLGGQGCDDPSPIFVLDLPRDRVAPHLDRKIPALKAGFYWCL